MISRAASAHRAAIDAPAAVSWGFTTVALLGSQLFGVYLLSKRAYQAMWLSIMTDKDALERYRDEIRNNLYIGCCGEGVIKDVYASI